MNADRLMKALAPLVAIADAYDESRLDEVRPEWQRKDEAEGIEPAPLSDVELFSGRGGRRLLTLGHAFEARAALREWDTRGVEPDRGSLGEDGSVRKAHYGDGRQPWDDIVDAGWGPAFAAGDVLKYLRRTKDEVASLGKARWYYDQLIRRAAGEVNGPYTSALERLEELLTQAERVKVRGS